MLHESFQVIKTNESIIVEVSFLNQLFNEVFIHVFPNQESLQILLIDVAILIRIDIFKGIP